MARRHVTVPNCPTPHTRREAANIIGCAPETLENYERQGLVTPQRAGNRPIYFDFQIKIARKIYQRNTRRG